MKKIIALAVASAFVAPAFAAPQVAVSGAMAFIAVNTDGAGDSIVNDDGNTFAISGSDEIGDGMSYKATFQIEDDSGTLASDGSNIVLKGPFGKLGLGDNSGAIDSVGDYSDVAAHFGGFLADGDDSSYLWTLPLPVEVNISYSPDVNSASGSGLSVQNNVFGLSVEHSFGPVTVYYGQEKSTENTDENKFNAYGVRYKANGITVAFEAANEDHGGDAESLFNGFEGHTTTDTAEIEYTGVAAAYTTGPVTIAVEKQSADQAGAALADTSIVSAAYKMGSATFFVANSDDSETDVQSVAAGVRVSF